jgi:hypothetical protein
VAPYKQAYPRPQVLSLSTDASASVAPAAQGILSDPTITFLKLTENL